MATGSETSANTSAKVLEVDALRYLERLSPFDGKFEDLPIFLANVEDIMPLLTSYNAAGQTMLINIIKSKLIGRARQVIEIHTHLTTWIDIKRILVINFSSHKSLNQLYEELRSVTFKSNTLEFYSEIQNKLSILNQKSKQENELNDIPRNIITALNVFKRNIAEPMRSILFSRNPQTIENALSILSEGGYLDNSNNNSFFYNKRNSYQQNKSFNNSNFQNTQKPNFNNNFRQNYQQNDNNYNQNNFFNPNSNQYRQKFNYNSQYQQQNQLPSSTQRNNNPPEPMNVDPNSSQIKRGYMLEHTPNSNVKIDNISDQSRLSAQQQEDFRYSASNLPQQDFHM